MTASETFWRDPPWRGGTAKHRLGLHPVHAASWLSPADDASRAHKESILATRYEDAVAVVPRGVAAERALTSVKPPSADRFPDAIANVAMDVRDDLCLLDVPDSQRLVAGCVCSPSYWRLRDKIGKSLWRVHRPVQGMNRKIGASIRHFVERAPTGQPFERHNWFLHGEDALFRLAQESEIAEDASTWFVRSERQTLCRLTDRYLLFSIDVRCEPLADIVAYPAARDDLIAALVRMDCDEVAHFGGCDKHARLIAYLDNLKEST